MLIKPNLRQGEAGNCRSLTPISATGGDAERYYSLRMTWTWLWMVSAWSRIRG